jgi:hypothetical protein
MYAYYTLIWRSGLFSSENLKFIASEQEQIKPPSQYPSWADALPCWKGDPKLSFHVRRPTVIECDSVSLLLLRSEESFSGFWSLPEDINLHLKLNSQLSHWKLRDYEHKPYYTIIIILLTKLNFGKIGLFASSGKWPNRIISTQVSTPVNCSTLWSDEIQVSILNVYFIFIVLLLLFSALHVNIGLNSSY